MTQLSWPASVPSCPVAGSVAISRTSPIAVFEPDYGLPIRRLRSTSAIKNVSMSIVMTIDQYRLFNEWYKKTLRHGVLPFYRQDPEDKTGQTISEFVFSEPYSHSDISYESVIVSVSLMCKDRIK